MKGYKYAVAVARSEYHEAIHTDDHMFFMKMQEEQPDTIRDITTQLLLKAGLKEWEKTPTTL